MDLKSTMVDLEGDENLRGLWELELVVEYEDEGFRRIWKRIARWSFQASTKIPKLRACH